MTTVLDHLVVAAPTLAEGVAWCEATLGVTPGPGGQHPLMGTHNRLFDISSDAFPDCFFEIIAIDPEAPAPQRARWFGLDRMDLGNGPRLIHAVLRSTQLDMHRAGLVAAGCNPGVPVRASRQAPQGLLSWDILVRDDGCIGCDGALPTLIQWQGAHPAPRMAHPGVTLRSLALHGVPARARDVLRLRGVAVGAGPAVSAVFDTPHMPNGSVTLHSR